MKNQNRRGDTMLKNKTKEIAAAAVLAMTLASGVAFTEAAQAQTVTKAGSNATVQANPKNFTGTAWVTSLFSAHNPSKTYAATVTFTPGARTNWHIHATGQSLIVTEGFGYTQEWGKTAVALYPGDVVWCPPGVKHWHGASPTVSMSHIAVSEASSEGVTWLEPVTDREYPK